MPLYERSVGFASLQSLWAFISGILALLAPPVAPNTVTLTIIAKGQQPLSPHQHSCLLMNALLVLHPHYPLLCTITLASLVKGRWIDGKAQALILLLSACDMPTIFMLQTFCRQDGGIAQQPLSPHNPFQNRTIPLPCTTFSAPLSKVSWITTKLLLS